MFRCTLLLASGLLAISATNSALAGVGATYQAISGAKGANDLSPDGRWIVGETELFRAYRYDTVNHQFMLLPLPATTAIAVSDDGQTVLGNMPDPVLGDDVAAIWTAASGEWQSLGYLPGAGSCPSRSSGYELSADGTVAVGLSWVNGCQARGFRWTQATGMVELPVLANGGNRASVCSANGQLMGGFAQGSFSRTPAIWTWNGSASGQLLDPPAGDALGEIHGINDAGTVLLGEWNQVASTWTYPGLVRTPIGAGSLLPGWKGVPQDIANDGTIVGFDFLLGNRRAWIQLGGTGPLIEFKSYIEANGAFVPSGVNLEVCQAISENGQVVIGHSMEPGAWFVRLSPISNCMGDAAPPGGNGVVNVDDLLAVINAWGQIGEDLPADVNDDLIVNVDDLLTVINAWGACPVEPGACCINSACSTLTPSACASAGGTFLGVGVPCSSTICQDNDHCVDAIDVTNAINGQAIEGDNSTATPPFGGGDVELPVGTPSCQWMGDPDSAHSTVWYSFVAPANGSVTISTCTSVLPFHDSLLALYSGSCGSLVEVGCDEDTCPSNFYSILTATGLTPGATYRLCVMNPGNHTHSTPGAFLLTITSP